MIKLCMLHAVNRNIKGLTVHRLVKVFSTGEHMKAHNTRIIGVLLYIPMLFSDAASLVGAEVSSSITLS